MSEEPVSADQPSADQVSAEPESAMANTKAAGINLGISSPETIKGSSAGSP